MNNIIFKTDLIKGTKGSKGDTGVSYEVPKGAVIAYDGVGIPSGYVETDPPPNIQSAVVTVTPIKLKPKRNLAKASVHVAERPIV